MRTEHALDVPPAATRPRDNREARALVEAAVAPGAVDRLADVDARSLKGDLQIDHVLSSFARAVVKFVRESLLITGFAFSAELYAIH